MTSEQSERVDSLKQAEATDNPVPEVEVPVEILALAAEAFEAEVGTPEGYEWPCGSTDEALRPAIQAAAPALYAQEREKLLGGDVGDALMDESAVVAALDKLAFDGHGYSVATANRMREALSAAIGDAATRLLAASPSSSSSLDSIRHQAAQQERDRIREALKEQAEEYRREAGEARKRGEQGGWEKLTAAQSVVACVIEIVFDSLQQKGDTE